MRSILLLKKKPFENGKTLSTFTPRSDRSLSWLLLYFVVLLGWVVLDCIVLDCVVLDCIVLDVFCCVLCYAISLKFISICG